MIVSAAILAMMYVMYFLYHNMLREFINNDIKTPAHMPELTSSTGCNTSSTSAAEGSGLVRTLVWNTLPVVQICG